MRVALSILLAASAMAAVQGRAICKDFKYTDNGSDGPTWEPTKLPGGSKDYTFSATWADGERPSSEFDSATFTVNFCQNVHTKPSVCSSAQPAMAYMVWGKEGGSEGNCLPLGANWDTVTSIQPYSYYLHDKDKPAIGYNIKYVGITHGGASSPDCKDTSATQSLDLALICGDSAFPTAGASTPYPTFLKFLEHGNDCDYELYVMSHAGCPKECPIVNNKVCAGQGVCRYDTGLNKARCFCDDGWIESDCTAPANPIPPGAVAGAIFGGIFLGLFAVGGYWGYQIYRQRGSSGSSTAGFAASGTHDEDGYYDAPLDG